MVKDYFTKEIETLKKNQEVPELKNSTNETKNALESIGNRADHMEERISELNYRNDTSRRRKRNKIIFKTRKFCESYLTLLAKEQQHYSNGYPRGEETEKGAESLLKK